MNVDSGGQEGQEDIKSLTARVDTMRIHIHRGVTSLGALLRRKWASLRKKKRKNKKKETKKKKKNIHRVTRPGQHQGAAGPPGCRGEGGRAENQTMYMCIYIYIYIHI